MITVTRTTTVTVADDTAAAITWLASEYPRGVELVSVDYRDSYNENIEGLQKLIKTGESDLEYYEDQWRAEDYIAAEYLKSTEADELSEGVRDAIRDWLYEHDTSNPERDLLRNTSRQLCFIETQDYLEKDNPTNVRALVKKYAKTPEQKKEIETACREAFYDAPVSFYFYADPEEMYDALYKTEAKYIVVAGAYFSTVDRVQGSNWLGDNAIFNIVVPRADFIANVFLDRAKGNGYSWNTIAGQTKYDDAVVSTSKTQPKGYLRLSPEVSEAQKREMRLQKHWDETKTCIFGDMNPNRHSGERPYSNNYPCGSTCTACGTFWID